MLSTRRCIKLLLFRGSIIQEQARNSEAIPSFQKAIDVKPDFADAYLNLGHKLKEERGRGIDSELSEVFGAPVWQ